MEQFRLARREYLARLQEAQQAFINNLTALSRSSRRALAADLQAELDRLEQRSALYRLLVENPHTPISTIWEKYVEHTGPRPTRKRSVRDPGQQRSKELKQRMINAAIGRIKHGETVRISEICEGLGVATGAPYSYFTGKNDLIDQAYDALFESLLASDADDEPLGDPNDE